MLWHVFLTIDFDPLKVDSLDFTVDFAMLHEVQFSAVAGKRFQEAKKYLLWSRRWTTSCVGYP